MKAIFLMCAFSLAFADKAFDTRSCLLKPEGGHCTANIPSYYYDYKTRTCKLFIYGGCGGNDNRFVDEDECMEKCGAFDRRSCLLEPEGGQCTAKIPSYYYDYKTRTCKEFIYGGCDGNDNRFVDEDECMEKCGDVGVFKLRSEAKSAPPAFCQLDKDTGPCRARFIRYYYNKETGQCEEFVYGGCLGNINNFRTKEECDGICC